MVKRGKKLSFSLVLRVLPSTSRFYFLGQKIVQFIQRIASPLITPFFSTLFLRQRTEKPAIAQMRHVRWNEMKNPKRGNSMEL